MKNTNNKFKAIKKAPICISLEPALIKEVAKLAKNLGCSKSKVIEEALIEYLAQVKKV
jgi:metal-responsive CopG/Arc/MetJ family transcriptional regulator